MKQTIIFFSLLMVANGLLAGEGKLGKMSESFPGPARSGIPSVFLTKDFRLNLRTTYYFIKSLKFTNPTISNSEIGTAFIENIGADKIDAGVTSASFRSAVESQLYDAEAIVRDIHDTYTTDDIAHQQAFGLVCAYSTMVKGK